MRRATLEEVAHSVRHSAGGQRFDVQVTQALTQETVSIYDRPYFIGTATLATKSIGAADRFGKPFVMTHIVDVAWPTGVCLFSYLADNHLTFMFAGGGKWKEANGLRGALYAEAIERLAATARAIT